LETNTHKHVAAVVSLPFYFVRIKVRLKMRLTVLLILGHDAVNNEVSTCVENVVNKTKFVSTNSKMQVSCRKHPVAQRVYRSVVHKARVLEWRLAIGLVCVRAAGDCSSRGPVQHLIWRLVERGWWHVMCITVFTCSFSYSLQPYMIYQVIRIKLWLCVSLYQFISVWNKEMFGTSLQDGYLFSR